MKKHLILFILLFSDVKSFAQKKSNQAFLDSNILGKSPCQGKTKTCLGWALLYGFYSYEYNLQNVNRTSSIHFNPYFNYQNIDCTEKGTNIEALLTSIDKKGISQSIESDMFCPQTCMSIETNKNIIKNSIISKSIFRNFISKDNKIILSDLKQFIKKEKGFVIIYSSNGDNNNDSFSGRDYWQKLVSGNRYRHAVFGIGYDDNKQAFLFSDSDWRGSKHRGEVWIKYTDIQNTNIIEQVISYNDSKNISFEAKNPKFEENTGSYNKKDWWLSKSIKFFKRYKYYYTQHGNFRLTLLKFPFFLTRKAVVGVLNSKNQKIYSFGIKPKQSVVFTVNGQSYKFTYTKKTRGKGKNKLYPEINYRLDPINENIL